jgi:hypothetical protein
VNVIDDDVVWVTLTETDKVWLREHEDETDSLFDGEHDAEIG